MNNTGYFLLLFLATTTACLLSACAPSAQQPAAQTRAPSVVATESTPPDWATCTVSLYNIPAADPDALAQARNILANIQAQTGWKDLHIIQTEKITKICRGYFEKFTTRQAQGTLYQVRNYTDSTGGRPYKSAMFALLPQDKEKQANAVLGQWDLRRAGGNSTLCIGFFINEGSSKNRMLAAAKKVKELRKQGVEAWYYHGEFRSGVYVGHFNASYRTVMVGRTRQGRPIPALKFVTDDPQFKVLRKKFPHYKRNGQALVFELGKRKAYESSRLARIPRPGLDLIDSDVGL